MKRSSELKSSHTGIIAAAVLFAALMLWFTAALSDTAEASERTELDSVKRSVENGISLCYSIEGAYPESLEYLTSGYGVVYDRDKYIVHYECFASNIRPAVTVIRKGD